MRTFIKNKKIILLFALVVFLFCSVFSISWQSAKASSTQLAVSSFVQKETGTNMQEMSVQTKDDYTGLWADNTTAYNGWSYRLNGTFYGDSKIEFANVRTGNSGYTFAIYDLSGNKVLNYHIGTAGTGEVEGISIAFVKVEKTDTTQSWNVFTLDSTGAQTRVQLTPGTNYQASINEQDRTALQASRVFLPSTLGRAHSGEITPGYFGLKFTDNSVEVVASTKISTVEEKTVASLDYTNYPEVSTLKNGYTVKVVAYFTGTSRTIILGDGYCVRPPMLLSVNGVSFNAEKKDFEENHREISYTEEVFDGTDNVICLKKGMALEEFGVATYTDLTSTGLGKFRYFLREEKFGYENASAFADYEYGDYPITVSYGGFTKEYLIKIDYFTTDLFTASPSSQTGTQQGSVSFQPMTDLGVGIGLKVKKEVCADGRGGQKWWFDINGVFTGDGSIEYVFADNKDMQEAVSFICMDTSGKRVFTFFVLPYDYQDTTNYYLGGLFLESDYEAGNTYNTFVFSGETDVSATTVTFSKTAQTQNIPAMKEVGKGVFPKFGEVCKLALDFTDSALILKANTAFGEKSLLVLDYQMYPQVQAIGENGYTLRIANGENRNWMLAYNWASQPPSILSINNSALTGVTAPVLKINEKITYATESVEEGYNVISIDETDELDEFSYTSQSTIGGTLFLYKNSSTFVHSEGFSERTNGTYDINVAYETATKPYRVIVRKNIPQIYLNDNVYFRVITKDSTLNVSKTDVLVEDKKDGVIDNSKVNISIKAPNATSFVEYEDFTFDQTLLGRYEICYTVVNSVEMENSLVRIIENVGSVPEVELNGVIPKEGYVGQSITLPNSAKEDVELDCSVVFEGEVIENISPLRFEKEGVYSIVYKLVDANGVMAVSSYYITVKIDDILPVITIEEEDKKYKCGDTITAPKATVIDNVDGELSVNIICLFEGKQVGNNTLKATKTGIYTFVYNATDKSGNVAKEYVEVFVSSAETIEMEMEGGCKSSIRSIFGETVALSGIAIGIVSIKRKKESKR